MVACEPAAALVMGEAAFDHPSPGLDCEAFCPGAALTASTATAVAVATCGPV